MVAYQDDLFNSLVDNLKLSLDKGYEPLQDAIMQLINISSSLMEDHFAKYFEKFLPLMVDLLKCVENKTMQQKSLRAKTIESIGFMILSVSG